MLLTQGNSTRAVAIDSLLQKREPFPLVSSSLLSPGERTRVILFAFNLSNADAASLTVDAEDELHRHYDLPVEFVGPLQGAELAGITQIIVKLNDNLGEVGDVLVQLTYKGIHSNRARVGVGFVGGGLPDDVSRLSGHVRTSGGTGINGVLVTLSGPISGTTFTNAAGDFSFANLVQNDTYTVSVSKANYSFNQSSQTFNGLAGNPSANFTGTLLNYNISGKLTENNNPLSGLAVNLSGSQSATTTTDAGGNYSFTVPAEGNYTVTPATSQIYTFNPSSLVIFNLSGNVVFNFPTLARLLYSISGHINKNSKPLAGVTVSLAGSKNETVTTDAAGYYAFLNVTAGGNYTVTASKPNFTLSPSSQSFNNLDKNQAGDFNATLVSPTFTIRGQVLDETTPLTGITVNLTGSQSATTATDANGNYSFNVTAEGDYRVMPFDQRYSFLPFSSTVVDLGGNQILDFKTTKLFSVLEFDGSPQTVDYGDFFQLQPGKTELGKFFWEFWAMPGTNAYARYMLSDGYGGAHALLFGFVGDSIGKRYTLYGNVWNGITAIDFGSDDGPAVNEWGHMAVGWDGTYLYTYYDGVPVGLKPFSGPRLPAGDNNGGGKLYIGGSDHSNFMGRIAQVRGFEEVNPLEKNGRQFMTFRPNLIFGLTTDNSPTNPRSTFLSSFLRPAQSVPDLAGGRVGVLRGTVFSALNPMQSFPLPQFVIDQNAPNTSTTTGPVVPDGLIDAPLPAPNQAFVFDSFSRKNSTYAFEKLGGLGSTESGIAGKKVWKTAIVTGGTPLGNESFGILNGQAVTLSNFPSGSLAWVETGATTGNLLTRVSRHPGLYNSGIDTGIAFRVQDSGNFFFAFTHGDRVSTGRRSLIVGYWLDARLTYLKLDVPMPDSWVNLQVFTNAAGKIDVYADDALVYSTTSNLLANATGTGLFNPSNDALAYRWDNFIVYDQP